VRAPGINYGCFDGIHVTHRFSLVCVVFCLY